MDPDDLDPAWLAAVQAVFGSRLEVASMYVDLMTRYGVERGLIGPRETGRLWERHVLNSAVIAELVPAESRVIDVGSGAGLPGIPLAVARPDLDIVLLEPMARRVEWLTEMVQSLGLTARVVRGRAEAPEVRAQLAAGDVVTARAVAPLGKLAGWCMPLVRDGGVLLAMKGATAAEEVDRDRDELARAGAVQPEVVECGLGAVSPPTTVVRMRARTGRVERRRDDRHGGRRSRRNRTASRR